MLYTCTNIYIVKSKKYPLTQWILGNVIIDIACLPQGWTWFSNITSLGSFLVFVLFSELRLEVIVRFDDIGGIVDLPCLNYILQTTISELENGYYM